MSKFLLAVTISAWTTLPVFGQATPDKLTVPFSDPSRPGRVKAGLLNGSITVKAHNGKEVIVEARTRQEDPERRKGRDREPPEPGMRRIPMTAPGLEAQEENNVIEISAGSRRTVDLEIQVPARTSLKLSTVNSGHITVEGVEGEIEVNNVNGNVTLTNVAGSAVAHALNGRLQAAFTRVDPKPMSFSSLNGRIDVTFPADLKATVKMKSDNGDVYSDFEMTVKPSQQTVVENREGKGKYRVRIDKTVYATINGGGPEIQFSNFNGAIYIRKASK